MLAKPLMLNGGRDRVRLPVMTPDAGMSCGIKA